MNRGYGQLKFLLLEGKGSRQKQAELDGTPHPEMHDASWEEYRDAVLSA